MQDMKYAMSLKASAIFGVVTVALVIGLMYLLSLEGNASMVQVSLDIVLANIFLDSINKRRVTGDIVYTSDILTKPIVGFVNKCSDNRSSIGKLR